MKYTSEYLTDKPASAYEPHLSIVARRKVIDGKALMKKLAKERAHGFDSVEIADEKIKRYQAAEKAVEFWRNIR